MYVCINMYVSTSCEELTHWKRPWCWEGLRAGGEGTTEDEMAGWHHWLDGHESEWTPGVGDGQGGLTCCDSWGRKESDTTERLNWTELMVALSLIFTSACRLFLIVASMGYSSLQFGGFSLWWLLLSWAWTPVMLASIIVMHGLSCSVASEIFLDRIEFVSLALAGRFLIAGLPGKSAILVIYCAFKWYR